jgi:hypothetical protein
MKNPFSVIAIRKERLLGEILILENEVNNFHWGEMISLQEKAGEEIKNARAAAIEKGNKLDQSWIHYNNAELLMAQAMDVTQRHIRAQILLIETSKKVKGWRSEQIKFLLGDLCPQRLFSIGPEVLVKALGVRNDYFFTRFQKITLHKVNVRILTAIMSSLIAVIVTLSFFRDITQPDIFARALVVSGLFGALGAGFSFTRTLFSFDVDSDKIPEQLLGMIVTAIRFLIGASAGIITLILYESGFLSEIFAKNMLGAPIMYIVLSFVAGFSERWFVSLLGLVTNEKGKGKKKEE